MLSHNDLNFSNILIRNKEIIFIDYDYLTINSRYCDLSRIISTFDLNNNQISLFLESYGIENNNETYDKLKNWNHMNRLIDLIWSVITTNKNNDQ